MIGGEAIQQLLRNLNLNEMAKHTGNEIRLFDQNPKAKNKKNYEIKKKQQIRKLRLINHFIKEKNKPEWMVLNYLPVLPPDLRPILVTKGGVRSVLNLM